jgi:LysM repeat protein
MQQKPVRPARPVRSAQPNYPPNVPAQPQSRPANMPPRPPTPNARPVPAQAARPRPKPRPSIFANRQIWLLGGMGIVGLFVVLCMVLALGVGVIYGGGNILPGVSSAGVDLGGKSESEAAAAIQTAWQTQGIRLQDGDRTWQIDPVMLGISIDAQATAQNAKNYGRSDGGLRAMVRGLFDADVTPVISVDLAAAEVGLNEISLQVNQPALNAGVRLVNGQVEPTPAQEGRILDVLATLAALQQNPGAVLADGSLDLVMVAALPTITDSTVMVAQATLLLSSPLNINAYDPITNQSAVWSLPPEQWAPLLTAVSDPNSPTGLSLNIEASQLRGYLEAQVPSLGADRYLNIDESIESIQNAVAAQNTNPSLRVYHHDTQYTVKPGDTFSSIAYDYGVPYPWIQDANPDASDALSVGQTITVPSMDNFLPLPIVANKRIVVSISQQHVWVYENGQIIWDWVASTGISSSPTSPGIFQIQSHEENAYAGNWNLWMPHFMGVYRPVPSSEFMNGFHGFPTRGTSQLLWTGDLGHPVTYGCILVSSDNAKLLYEWAEPGVVVEIQR